MDERKINPGDAGFLISRSLDEPLTPQEQQRLDELLAQSESLRREAEQIRKVARLVKRWGVKSVELDWEQHARGIEAKLAAQEDEGLDRVDRLLRRWGADEVRIDGEAFRKAVLNRVRRTGKAVERPAWRSLTFRIGTPLAAAAVLVFAVTTGFWHRTMGMAICDVRFATPAVVNMGMLAADSESRVVVQFGQKAIESKDQVVGVSHGSKPAAREANGISFVAIGSAAPAETQIEMPPV